MNFIYEFVAKQHIHELQIESQAIVHYKSVKNRLGTKGADIYRPSVYGKENPSVF